MTFSLHWANPRCNGSLGEGFQESSNPVPRSFVACHLRDFAGSFRVKAHYESHASVNVILLNYAGLNLTCLLSVVRITGGGAGDRVLPFIFWQGLSRFLKDGTKMMFRLVHY